MLQSIRSRASSWVIKILFLVLILAFGVWGIEDIFRGPGQRSTVATVGSTSISVAELNSEFRRQVDRLRPMFGGQLDTDDVAACCCGLQRESAYAAIEVED